MSFKLKGIENDNFRLLNNYFSNGFESNKLFEQSQQINHPSVDISSNEWYFDGIRMGYSDWRYKNPIELEWNTEIKIELITFHANLNGSVSIGSSTGTASHMFSNCQHNLFYSPADTASEGLLRCCGMRASMFFIQFTKDIFLRLTQNANEALNHFADSIIAGRPAMLSANNLPMDAAMLNAINSIVHCSYENNLKKMYLLSKSIEFLVLQAEACNVALNARYRYVKTKYDIECIRYAREYIMSCLDEPPGLSELARIIGINEYKLKRGFKEMFGNTVFGYISDARLDMAKNDLVEKQKTVTEIASTFGYSSPQHFSAAFKKKFGVSPNKLKY